MSATKEKLHNEIEKGMRKLQIVNFIDKKFSEDLINTYDFLDFNIECEFEHSTETQMPFIKYYFKNTSIVEIIYGDLDFKKLSKLLNFRT